MMQLMACLPGVEGCFVDGRPRRHGTSAGVTHGVNVLLFNGCGFVHLRMNTTIDGFLNTVMTSCQRHDDVYAENVMNCNSLFS